MQTSEQLILDSYSLGGRFTSPCPVCTNKIVYQQSWALCNCPIFFHPQCFLQQINKRKLKKQPKLKCLYCQQSFQVQYSIKAQMECKKKIEKKQVSFLILLALSFSLTLFLAIKSVEMMNSESIDDNMTAIYLFVGMMVGLMVTVTTLGRLLMRICLREDTHVAAVKQLHKSIEFSAFKDLGITEENSDCMILQ